MSIPLDPALYAKVKSKVKRTVKSYPSAYASGLIVKEYKRLGGKYSSRKKPSSNIGLQRWFKEKWINVCEYPRIVPCGRMKGGYTKDFPYCRPLYKITSKTPRTVHSLSKKELQRRCSIKRKNPYKKLDERTKKKK